jgi:acetylornithine deacetylase/succinyl-diaminopimelate desuccinylase-like protein
MTELVVMPDAEQTVIDGLAEGLEPLGYTGPIGTRVPNPRPPASVQVLRTGGIAPTIISDQAEISIDVRAASESGAALLAGYVRAVMRSLEGQILGGVMVYRVGEASGPSNYPDPYTPDESRYTQLFTVHVRGDVLA